jgi:hypothetical protein
MQRCFCVSVLILTISLVAISARPNAQQPKPASLPNFSGTWKANIEKSSFGPAPVPKSMVYKIEHREPSVKLTSTRVEEEGEDTVTLTLTTDGKESSNMVHGAAVKSKLKWEGPALLIDSETTIDGNTFGLKDKWLLSDDGKTLTWLRHFVSPDGESGGGDATYILEKQ